MRRTVVVLAGMLSGIALMTGSLSGVGQDGGSVAAAVSASPSGGILIPLPLLKSGEGPN
jgi:hypothetical protein